MSRLWRLFLFNVQTCIGSSVYFKLGILSCLLFFALSAVDRNNVCICFCRHGTHAATAAATAGLPNGSGYAAEHAGHDGDELWGTNAPRSHAYAGELRVTILELLFMNA